MAAPARVRWFQAAGLEYGECDTDTFSLETIQCQQSREMSLSWLVQSKTADALKQK